MVVFNPHSIDLLETTLSPPSPSSLLNRIPQKQKHRKGTENLNQDNLSFDIDNNQDDVLGLEPSKPTLEQQARAFFKLAKVADRRENRYNAHGNRGSIHGQKNKLYRNVFAGSEAIDAMVASGLAPSREKALSLGNRLSLELNLFSRANPSNGNTRQTKPKGRARANLVAAQTILLGASDISEDDPTNRLATARAAAAVVPTEGCFADDANAFYRFGPGVLAILRGIDDDHARLRSGSQDKAVPQTIIAGTSMEESSLVSCEKDDQKKRKNAKNNSKKMHDHQHAMNTDKPKRNLSIVPNAPGYNGNIVLEDLFLLRRPEMATIAKRNSDNTIAAASTTALRGGANKKASKNSGSKKKTKKFGVTTHQPSVAAPSPLPKSILKNSSCDNAKTKKKKTTPSKITRNKTKGSHKKAVHKFKAGAKIKYISHKERKVASIEKRLSAFHCDHQIALYRQMLKELENKLSRLYTGDHIEIISLSSHSSFPPSPKKHYEIGASTGGSISDDDQSLVNDCKTGDIGAGVDENDNDNDNDCDFERDDTFDNALESLDDIISNTTDLLACGDDSASAWTEFIMGTSRRSAEAEANGDSRGNANPKRGKPEAKTKSVNGKKKEAGSSSPTPAKAKKYSKVFPNKAHQLPKAIKNEGPETKDHLIEQYHQQSETKKTQPPTGWQAPAPLESNDGTGRNKTRNKARGYGNEIDLSAWAMINRDREAEAKEAGDWTESLCFPGQTVPPTSKFDAAASHGIQSFNSLSTENGDSAFLVSSAQDKLSILASDDLSLLLEQQQEREFQTLQLYARGDGCLSKGQGCEVNSSWYLENAKKTNAYPTTKSSVAMNSANSSGGSFRSNITKDSNDLAKLRLVPHRRKNGSETNITSSPGKDEIIDGGEAQHRGYHFIETKGAKVDESALEPQPTPIPTSYDSDASTASDETGSGIMEAIEQDPFYQKAVAMNDSKHIVSTAEENNKEAKDVSDSSPVRSEPGSFTASYNDSHFQDSFDDFDGEEASINTYSEEGSYMELTVGDEEIPFEEFEEEVIEEEIIEEEEELYEEITVVSESINQGQSPDIGPRPKLSPRRKAAQFRSTMNLPSVPELGPEPEPEPEPQPTSPQRENSVYVEVHSMADDDEMTQITMDCFLSSSFRSNRSLHIIPEDDYSINHGDYSNHKSYLFPLKEEKDVQSAGGAVVSPMRNRNSRTMKKSSQLMPLAPTPRQQNQFSARHHLKQRTKYVASSSSSPMGGPCGTVLSTETSQERIQEILWKDLPSSDVTVTWSALEELRILVANESRSRAYLVRHGGVMVIIDTMAEQLEVEVIQFLCCNILGQLASMDFEIGLTILELGGVALIEQSMKKHVSSHRVKEMGDVALRALLRN